MKIAFLLIGAKIVLKIVLIKKLYVPSKNRIKVTYFKPFGSVQAANFLKVFPWMNSSVANQKAGF